MAKFIRILKNFRKSKIVDKLNITSMVTDYTKVLSILSSCETDDHFKCASKYANLFCIKHFTDVDHTLIGNFLIIQTISRSLDTELGKTLVKIKERN